MSVASYPPPPPSAATLVGGPLELAPAIVLAPAPPGPVCIPGTGRLPSARKRKGPEKGDAADDDGAHKRARTESVQTGAQRRRQQPRRKRDAPGKRSEGEDPEGGAAGPGEVISLGPQLEARPLLSLREAVAAKLVPPALAEGGLWRQLPESHLAAAVANADDCVEAACLEPARLLSILKAIAALGPEAEHLYFSSAGLQLSGGAPGALAVQCCLRPDWFSRYTYRDTASLRLPLQTVVSGLLGDLKGTNHTNVKQLTLAATPSELRVALHDRRTDAPTTLTIPATAAAPGAGAGAGAVAEEEEPPTLVQISYGTHSLFQKIAALGKGPHLRLAYDVARGRLSLEARNEEEGTARSTTLQLPAVHVARLPDADSMPAEVAFVAHTSLLLKALKALKAVSAREDQVTLHFSGTTLYLVSAISDDEPGCPGSGSFVKIRLAAAVAPAAPAVVVVSQ